jgi:hypothetical protein
MDALDGNAIGGLLIVVRCRTCGSVLMVFVRAHDVIGTDLTGLASLSQPDRPLSRPSG